MFKKECLFRICGNDIRNVKIIVYICTDAWISCNFSFNTAIIIIFLKSQLWLRV